MRSFLQRHQLVWQARRIDEARGSRQCQRDAIVYFAMAGAYVLASSAQEACPVA